jgi:poly(3-hydroxybutyrate) depolymerase
MRFEIIILFMLSLMLAPSARADSKIVKETFDSGGRKRAYHLFVPEKVTPAVPAPLIVALHGSGGDGRAMVQEWKELASRQGIIVAGPNSLSSAGWSLTEDGPALFGDLVEELKAKHPIDAKRVYIFGYSAGAVYALQLALMESEYFAAAAVFAGALDVASFSRIDRAKRKIPIALFVGTEDPFFPLVKVRATRNELSSRGFPVQLKEIANHDNDQDHNYFPLAHGINRDAWKFLSSHRLSGEPRFEQYNFR